MSRVAALTVSEKSIINNSHRLRRIVGNSSENTVTFTKRDMDVKNTLICVIRRVIWTDLNSKLQFDTDSSKLKVV